MIRRGGDGARAAGRGWRRGRDPLRPVPLADPAHGIASATEVREADVARVRPAAHSHDAPALGWTRASRGLDPHGWMRVRTGGYTGPPIDFSSASTSPMRCGRSGRPSATASWAPSTRRPSWRSWCPCSMRSHAHGAARSGIRLDRLSVGADSIRYAAAST